MTTVRKYIMFQIVFVMVTIVLSSCNHKTIVKSKYIYKFTYNDSTILFRIIDKANKSEYCDTIYILNGECYTIEKGKYELFLSNKKDTLLADTSRSFKQYQYIKKIGNNKFEYTTYWSFSPNKKKLERRIVYDKDYHILDIQASGEFDE